MSAPRQLAVGNHDAQDKFVIITMKVREGEKLQSKSFIDSLVATVRAVGGKVQMRTERPEDWEVFDGKENLVSPNHLSPAVFDFTAVLIAAFQSIEATHVWWNSDKVFDTLRKRDSIEKIGIHIVEGLRAAFDIHDDERMSFGEKFVFMEFIQMQSFSPTQKYLDLYKRFSEKAILEIGMDCNLLFSESTSGILMNEFPVDALCASAWRLKTDPKFWYDSVSYTTQLHPWRREYSTSLTVLMPIRDRSSLGKKDKDGRWVLADID